MLVLILQPEEPFVGGRQALVIYVFLFELLVAESRDIVKTFLASNASTDFLLLVICNGIHAK